MDQVDKSLLCALQNDSSRSIAELAELVGASSRWNRLA
jgi:DNA-binding Lrp family transcriptional regulator